MHDSQALIDVRTWPTGHKLNIVPKMYGIKKYFNQGRMEYMVFPKIKCLQKQKRTKTQIESSILSLFGYQVQNVNYFIFNCQDFWHKFVQSGITWGSGRLLHCVPGMLGLNCVHAILGQAEQGNVLCWAEVAGTREYTYNCKRSYVLTLVEGACVAQLCSLWTHVIWVEQSHLTCSFLLL